MNKTLIIVDPQYDFIEGGKLPVEGGKEALDSIVDYINSGELSMVIITQDCHCGSHCSFKEYGGDWPEHCVEGTHGAEIYKPIMDAIEKNHIMVYYLQKGHYLEAYSAFRRQTEGYAHWKEYATEDSKEPYLQFHEDEIIQICGLAGDVCVMQTAIALKDLRPVIIEELTASLDKDNFRKLADLNGIIVI